LILDRQCKTREIIAVDIAWISSKGELSAEAICCSLDIAGLVSGTLRRSGILTWIQRTERAGDCCSSEGERGAEEGRKRRHLGCLSRMDDSRIEDRRWKKKEMTKGKRECLG
jgi:hypothetical protein